MGEVVPVADEPDSQDLDQGEPAGFWYGLTQVRWWVSVFSSVVNCVAVRPVVGCCGNGLSRCRLRIFLAIYPQGCPPGGAVV